MELSYILSVMAAIFAVGILAAWTMMALSVAGMYTEWPVLGKGEFQDGTRSNMIAWVHKAQELAASHPQVWRKINLTRGLISAPWYNAVRDVLMGAGRALPRCPTREEPPLMYEDKEVSDDTSDSCSEEDVMHRVAAQSDFLAAMKDGLAVDNERTAWTKLTESIVFGYTGPNGVPTERDCSRLAGELGKIFDETGEATWGAWNAGEVADHVIKIIARGFPRRTAQVGSALKAGKASGEEDTWRAVLERLGGIVGKIETAEEECKLLSQIDPAPQHQRESTGPLVVSCSQQGGVRSDVDPHPGQWQNWQSRQPAVEARARGRQFRGSWEAPPPPPPPPTGRWTVGGGATGPNGRGTDKGKDSGKGKEKGLYNRSPGEKRPRDGCWDCGGLHYQKECPGRDPGAGSGGVGDRPKGSGDRPKGGGGRGNGDGGGNGGGNGGKGRGDGRARFERERQ